MSLDQNLHEVRILNLERQLAWALRTIQEMLKRHSATEQQVGMAWTQMGNQQASTPLVVQAAVLTGSLATGTLASPSSAGATLYAESGGSWSSGGSITVKNTYPLTTSLASGKQVWVVPVNGTYYMITSEC